MFFLAFAEHLREPRSSSCRVRCRQSMKEWRCSYSSYEENGESKASARAGNRRPTQCLCCLLCRLWISSTVPPQVRKWLLLSCFVASLIFTGLDSKTRNEKLELHSEGRSCRHVLLCERPAASCFSKRLPQMTHRGYDMDVSESTAEVPRAACISKRRLDVA